jgi:type I restriction enzyme M protein
MLAPHIKKKVDKLWDRFWSAGLTNPLVAVEQITYLIFLQRLELLDKKRADAAAKNNKRYVSIYEKRTSDPDGINPEKCQWKYIRQESNDVRNLIDNVFPWLRSIESRLSQSGIDDELSSLNNRMTDAYFQLDPNKGQVLADAIALIDELFARAAEGSAAQDIMGDTFEYLLSEVASAGKNGQFRTPRHLIRFMVELLDPEPDPKQPPEKSLRIIDPAAGTGGFLFSAQQYLMRKFTTPGNLVLEWDGAPHRTDDVSATNFQREAIHHGRNFVGIDNDRTMARIGWMNMVLHDITDPRLLQGDSLSKRDGKPELAELLTPESYRYVLANPPFTGTVDTEDLDKDAIRFPRVGGGGKKKSDAVTNKSELLFLWLMLDLLEIGGRCAVIIPEGVLFGNTDAHVRLRRELLNEHVVEGVISLPGGVFQPYTGVKTSILLFRKETGRDSGKQPFTGQTPRTEHVWFYEVEDHCYSNDAKRTERKGKPNDLWDALVKFKAWLAEGRAGAQQNEKILLQPRFREERWRQALLLDTSDQLTPSGHAFSSLSDTSMWDGRVWNLHELFPDLPAAPNEATAKVREAASAKLLHLAINHFIAVANQLWSKWVTKEASDEKLLDEWRKAAKLPETNFKRAAREVEKFFEKEDSPALPLWKELVKEALASAQADKYVLGILRANHPPKPLSESDQSMEAIAREVAKLDGFDVTLRSIAIDQTSPLTAAKHWVVPVREWARNDEWQSEDGTVNGSHDANGLVRPQYIDAMLAAKLYDESGTLKDGLLDPDCIEAREWNLSAGQYKPFDFTQLKSDKSVSELIDQLRSTEQKIISGLDTLLAMVEGRE